MEFFAINVILMQHDMLVSVQSVLWLVVRYRQDVQVCSKKELLIQQAAL